MVASALTLATAALLLAGPEAVSAPPAVPDRSATSALPGGSSATDPAIAAAPAPGPTRPDLRPRLRVTGLDDLAALEADAEVGGRVEGLRARRRGAIFSLVGAGVGVSVAGVFAAFAKAEADIHNIGVGGTCDGADCRVKPDYGPAYVALGISGGLALLAAVIWPRDPAVREVVEIWNGRHPGEPVELAGESQVAADESPAR